MERFQAAFQALCVQNREANNIDIDTSVVADDDPEELHAFMAQKVPKNSADQLLKSTDQQHNYPGNINRLLSPPRHNTDVT